MKLKISVAQLQQACACAEAIAIFRECFGEETEQDWTRELQKYYALPSVAKELARIARAEEGRA
jgi:hypothetical protein